jgi:hypothetical protein
VRYAIEPRGTAERLAIWLGLAPVAAIDVLVPLVQTRAIMAAVTLGVFEALRDGPRTPEDLARSCRLDGDCLELLLRVLASTRYARRLGARYALSRVGRRTLLRGSPAELCGYVELNYQQWRWIEGLESTLTSGTGVDFHAALPAASDAWAAYQRAMLELERPVAPLLARHIPVPRHARKLLDLGGGPGLLGAAVCAAHPRLTSTVIDLEAALPEAKRLAQAEGISPLVTHRAGDLIDCQLESNVDVVLLGNVLHHFSRTRRQQLLERAFESLNPNGTIAIWETEARAQTAAPELASDAIALYFRVTSSAPALTASELTRLLSDAGFERLELRRPLTARGRLLIHGRKPRAVSVPRCTQKIEG